MNNYWHALLLGFIVALAQTSQAANPLRPNIIWIMADDLGYGEVGCYGQKHIQTPQIDRLAAEGMRFTQCYAGSTVCAPSRSVLMTGQHVGHTRVRGNASVKDYSPQNLDRQDITVAEVLKQAGYATALVGKWGLGVEGTDAMPTRQGFDFFYGYLNQTHAHNSWPEFLIKNEARVPLRNQVRRDGKEYEKLGAGIATNKVDYAPALMLAEALQWLESHKDKPFFLYFSPVLPHANNELQSATKAGQECNGQGIYASQDWPDQDKCHAAAITELDNQVGQIMALLKKLGLDEKTLVFFTSDNGPHKEGGQDLKRFQPSGPLRGIKRDLYEGGIRVPFIARWPAKVPAGTTHPYVGYFGDLMATAAELAGVQPPRTIDSLSLVPTLLRQSRMQKQHAYLYWEFHEKGFHQAIRMGDWKGIRYSPKKPLELYQLSLDLHETNNIAGQHKTVVKKIERLMHTARSASKHWPIREPNPSGTKQTSVR
jgi:uncharacterized sulfatase